MRYRITGADSKSGRDIEVILDVAGKVEAEREAKSRGIFISSISVDDSSRSDTASQAFTRTPTRSRTHRRFAVFAAVIASSVIILIIALVVRSAHTKEEKRLAEETFRGTVAPFAREVRGLSGRMDAGLTYNDYSSKVGDLAAAYAGIDRSDISADRGIQIDAADEAYEAFKNVRRPWKNYINHPYVDQSKQRFDEAFALAATKADLFLQTFDAEGGTP